MEIPDILYSTDTGKPFTNCMVCNKPLLEAASPYFIEKAFKHYRSFDLENVIFEFAMCLECAEKLHKSMSEESVRKIEEYFKTRVDFEERNKQMMESENPELDQWISKCIIKNTPIKESDEYHICIMCFNKILIFTQFPYAIGGEALEEIQELLSKQTLDEMDGFIGKYFTGPPEFREYFKSKKLILI